MKIIKIVEKIFRLSFRYSMILIIGAMFSGWAIVDNYTGRDRSGLFGRTAVIIATFPVLAETVIKDLLIDIFNKYRLLRVPNPEQELTAYSSIRSTPDIKLDGVLLRKSESYNASIHGWRILVGAFILDGQMKHAALFISPELEVVKVINLDEVEVDGRKPIPAHRKLAHGFEVMKDGSVIFALDNGLSLQRISLCGERLWSVKGNFHHAVTRDDEGFIWTLNSPYVTNQLEDILKLAWGDITTELVKIKVDTGEIVRRFSMQDISKANPEIDIFEIRKFQDQTYDESAEKWGHDAFHINDVDPLTAEKAVYFDEFDEGDLLISSRSLNLVFVVDPDNLKVKWWRIGVTKRQHDPDWGKSGEITIFDNRMNRGYSRIVSISPKTFQTNVIYDGRKSNFYSRIRGKHQITDEGNLVVTSPQQGRVFEVNPTGEISMEFLNTVPGNSAFNYSVSEAIWLPDNYFDTEMYGKCESNK